MKQEDDRAEPARRQPAAEARWHYRAIREYVYKQTPQGELRIYVHFPFDWEPRDRRPAILFFFGGAFLRGTVEHFTRQATYLASRAMVAARADYRVKLRHGVTVDKCVQDAKSAMRWLRGNAEMLGIDSEHIVAAGGSSGGHLAASTSVIEGLDEEGEQLSVSPKPNALLLFNPALQLPLDDRVPTEELAEQLSPVLHLTRDLPPTLMLFGTQDRFLPPAQAFIAKAKGLGCRVELYVAEGARHGFFNRAPWFKRTLYRADEFLASLGYVDGKPTFEAR